MVVTGMRFQIFPSFPTESGSGAAPQEVDGSEVRPDGSSPMESGAVWVAAWTILSELVMQADHVSTARAYSVPTSRVVSVTLMPQSRTNEAYADDLLLSLGPPNTRPDGMR